MSDKADHERSVLLEFCRSASLPLDDQSIQQREPPEPDILCFIGAQQRYFELGRLLDPEMTKLTNWSLRHPGEFVKPEVERIGLPERDMLAQKLEKLYMTNGVRCDLLLYYDADRAEPHLAGGIPPIPFPDYAWAVMQPILEKSTGPFERVWVYERYRKTVLWHFPSTKFDAA